MAGVYAGEAGTVRLKRFAATMALLTSVVAGSALAQDGARAIEAPTGTDSTIDRSMDEPSDKKQRLARLDLSWLPDARNSVFAFMVGLFVLALISEDMACIVAGLLVAVGKSGFLVATVACFFGILLGDLAWFLAGRYVGRPVLNYPPAKWLVGKNDLEVAEKWFSKRGATLLLLSRFLPGSRTAVFLSAGMLGVNVWRALAYFAIASAIWSPLLIGLAASFGKPLLQSFESYREYALAVLACVAVLFWFVLKMLARLSRQSAAVE